MTSAFFYGALMHPKILKRVLHNDASDLKICPSILSVSVQSDPIPRHDIKRAILGIHAGLMSRYGQRMIRVSTSSIVSTITHADSLHQDADYPAIVRSERSKAVLGRELTSEENSTPGILVSDLSTEGLSILDAF
jgi:hypothetical protein